MLRSLVLITVLGCGGKQEPAPTISNTSATPAESPPAPAPAPKTAAAKLREFRDAMCKCAEHDVECANAISDDMTTWAANQPRSTDPIPTQADPEMARIAQDMVECMTKAMTPDISGSGSASHVP